MANNWRLYGSDTVAYVLDKAELPGWIRKKVVVGPGEGALVLRDGRAEGLLTEGADKVQGAAAGLFNKLFGWITGQQDVQVIFVDLGPIRVPIYLGETQKQEEAASSTPSPDGWIHAARTAQVSIQALTADQEVVNAECIVTLKVDTENPSRIAGLLKNGKGLSRWDLAAMIRDEAMARILVPHLATVKAADIRGNRDLASRISSWARAELDTSLRTFGLVLIDLVINWGLTDTERAQIARHRGELEEEALKFAHTRRLAEMGRDLEIEKTRVENLQQVKVAQAQGDESLRDLYLAGSLRREELQAAFKDKRTIDAATIDAEVRVIQLGVEQKEAALRIANQRSSEMMRLDVEDRKWRQDQEKRLAQIDAEDKEMRNMVAMQIQVATAKHDRETASRRMELDFAFRKQEMELTNRFEERKVRLQEDLARMNQVQALMSAGLSAGAVNADVMKTFLSESTRQSYGTTSDAKTASLFDSEKAKGNLDTFKEAEQREREQQREMTRLSADMMQAAKQTPGAAVVMGSAPAQPPIAVTPQPAAPQPAAAPDTIAARLARLKQLHQDGLIDDAEFKQRKAAILEEV